MNENGARGNSRGRRLLGRRLELLAVHACWQFVGGPLMLVFPCRREFSSGCFVFGSGAVAVSSENLASTHVVVAVPAPVGIARLCGLLRLLHVTPPDSVTSER
jgi:hypothetical protein